MLAAVAFADGGPVDDDFSDLGPDGWNGSSNTLLSFWTNQTFGTWPFQSIADGVMELNLVDGSTGQGAEIQKSVYMQPGQYVVRVRAAGQDLSMWRQEQMCLRIAGDNIAVTGEYFGVPVPFPFIPVETNRARILNAAVPASVNLYDKEFSEFTSAILEVLYPGQVTFSIVTNGHAWYDYIHVDPLSDSEATATPQVQSPTPRPWTPVPAENQATAMPTPTRYCNAGVPTATPGPGPFGTPVPTASPDPANWGFLSNFDAGNLDPAYWSALGSGIVNKPEMYGPDGTAGILYIPYSVTSTNGLVLNHVVTPTMHVDGYAELSEAIPTGTTARLVVYLYDATDTWLEVGHQDISYAAWYPFHITISAPGGTPPYTAVSVAFERSDSPTGSGGYLDDLYFYGAYTMRPYCDGTYPVTAFVAPNGTDIWPGGTTDNVDVVDISVGRPCPPPTLTVPDNFWGPLLKAIQVIFLEMTGQFPLHVPGDFYTPIYNLIESPIWKYASVATMIFDLRPILLLAIVLIVLELVRLIYSAWRLLLKIIPAAG